MRCFCCHVVLLAKAFVDGKCVLSADYWIGAKLVTTHRLLTNRYLIGNVISCAFAKLLLRRGLLEILFKFVVNWLVPGSDIERDAFET